MEASSEKSLKFHDTIKELAKSYETYIPEKDDEFEHKLYKLTEKYCNAPEMRVFDNPFYHTKMYIIINLAIEKKIPISKLDIFIRSMQSQPFYNELLTSIYCHLAYIGKTILFQHLMTNYPLTKEQMTMLAYNILHSDIAKSKYRIIRCMFEAKLLHVTKDFILECFKRREFEIAKFMVKKARDIGISPNEIMAEIETYEDEDCYFVVNELAEDIRYINSLINLKKKDGQAVN